MALVKKQKPAPASRARGVVMIRLRRPVPSRRRPSSRRAPQRPVPTPARTPQTTRAAAARRAMTTAPRPRATLVRGVGPTPARAMITPARAGRDRAEADPTTLIRAGRDLADPDRAGLAQVAPVPADPVQADPVPAGVPDRAGRDQAGPDRADQGRVALDRAGAGQADRARATPNWKSRMNPIRPSRRNKSPATGRIRQADPVRRRSSF